MNMGSSSLTGVGGNNNILQLVRAPDEGVEYHVDVGTNQDVIIMASRSVGEKNIVGDDDQVVGVELSVWETTIDSLPLQDDCWGRSVARPKTGYVITDMDLLENYLVLYERSTLEGRQRIRVIERRNCGEEWIVPVPESSHDEPLVMLSAAGNMHYQSKHVRFHAESPSMPRKTYEYAAQSRRLALLSDDNGNNGDIVQVRTVVSSEDGTLVPLSLVYRKEVQFDEERDAIPVVLMGYGAYGQSMDLAFDPTVQPLLDRGFVLAYAHTRGGGDLGKTWHHRGRLYEKVHAVEDYVACAEALVGYLLDKPVQVTAKAFSAGGVVIGAAVNRRPGLFCSVVLTNAFLDVNATMRNHSLPLTQHEWDEYGNPLEDHLAAESIASYCPVTNIQGCEYQPSFLLVGTLDDIKVPVWNPVIFGKKLRDKNGKVEVLLHVEGQGGHHLLGNRLHVAALEAAFIIGNIS
jgi:oligopeptidase B